MSEVILSSIPLGELVLAIQTAVKQELERNSEFETPPQPKSLLTRKETANILGISLVTLNTYTKRGIIPSYVVGNKIFYKQDEVNSSLRSRKFAINEGRD